MYTSRDHDIDHEIGQNKRPTALASLVHDKCFSGLVNDVSTVTHAPYNVSVTLRTTVHATHQVTGAMQHTKEDRPCNTPGHRGMYSNTYPFLCVSGASTTNGGPPFAEHSCLRTRGRLWCCKHVGATERGPYATTRCV
jgi:hypothetical protein